MVMLVVVGWGGRNGRCGMLIGRGGEEEEGRGGRKEEEEKEGRGRRE